jgi:Ca2+-binding EF-hand superfamily protein
VLMCIMQGSATAQKAPIPKAQDKLALGENDVKQLMLLIDADKNGKITKQAWMEFMEAEFDRLDKNKSGELDAQELAQSRLRVSPFAKVGK